MFKGQEGTGAFKSIRTLVRFFSVFATTSRTLTTRLTTTDSRAGRSPPSRDSSGIQALKDSAKTLDNFLWGTTLGRLTKRCFFLLFYVWTNSTLHVTKWLVHFKRWIKLRRWEVSSVRFSGCRERVLWWTAAWPRSCRSTRWHRTRTPSGTWRSRRQWWLASPVKNAYLVFCGAEVD